jgi:hypothetical protein
MRDYFRCIQCLTHGMRYAATWLEQVTDDEYGQQPE